MYSAMQVGQSKFGMQTMNQALLALYGKRVITLDEAMGRSGNPEEFRNMLNDQMGAKSGQGRPRQAGR